MGDFAKVFAYFENCSLTCFEKKLISELYPVIKRIVEKFTKIRGYDSWPRYDIDTDTRKILGYKEKIDRIVKVLDSSDHQREVFLKNFPIWKIQRKQNIEKLRKIAKSLKEVRQVSNRVKITAGSVGLAGGATIIRSSLFPPAASSLLSDWLIGAATSALLPPVFLGAGGAATAGGGIGNVGASITELELTDKTLDEAKVVIAKDKGRLKDLGVFEFLDELNYAIDDLFGKNTSSKILNDIIEFLNKVPPISDDIQPIQNAVHTCLMLILPGINRFLFVGISLASVILSIFFVVFLIRRRGCAILNHRLALGLVSAVDASVRITRLIAAAGLKGSKLGELIPRQLAGKIAVGAMAGVGIALDIASIVMSSIDLAEGSLGEEISMIFEVANKLENNLTSYQRVNDELQKCVARRLNSNDMTDWTAVVVFHVPLDASHRDITSGFNQYLPDEARDYIILEKLPTDGNNWLVKVPTSHAQMLLRQTYINIKRERCLVMK